MMHSTNYTNTFIGVADDCKVEVGTIPPEKAEKTIARMQYELISNSPYGYTSDELLFMIFATRQQIDEAELGAQRAQFFSKGQPCLRSSALGKTYGWGIHYDHESKIAIVGRETEAYERLKADHTLQQLKAMRSSK